MKEVLDRGHKYNLLILDRPHPYYFQALQFVKRCNPPEKYPGNRDSYPGTTLQSVIRCLIERVNYLQGQFWCLENWFIKHFLSLCLWLLEFRAGRRHGFFYFHTPHFASYHKMCPECGHTQCHHE